MLLVRLTVVLALVSAIAAGALALTYQATKEKIEKQEEAAKTSALKSIFFNMETTEYSAPLPKHKNIMAVYDSQEAMEAQKEPLYYAAEGEAIGYNASVPIRLLVGFTNPTPPARKLLEGYVPENAGWMPAEGETGLYIVGWKVIASEETPGLGEKAKAEKAPYTWTEKLTGTASDPGPDRRTDFQRQFSGRMATPESLKSKKDGGPIDIITAATYSTRGITGAISDAASAVEAALNEQP